MQCAQCIEARKLGYKFCPACGRPMAVSGDVARESVGANTPEHAVSKQYDERFSTKLLRFASRALIFFILFASVVLLKAFYELRTTPRQPGTASKGLLNEVITSLNAQLPMQVSENLRADKAWAGENAKELYIGVTVTGFDYNYLTSIGFAEGIQAERKSFCPFSRAAINAGFVVRYNFIARDGPLVAHLILDRSVCP